MKKMLNILLVITSQLPLAVYAQPIGARSFSLGGGEAALQDPWSVAGNPAGLAALKKITAAISYSNLYGNPAISARSAAFIFPVGKYTGGIHLFSYGFEAFTEQRVSLAYSGHFGKDLFLGMKVNYHTIRIPAYGSASAGTVEAGIQYTLFHQLLAGIHVVNPSGTQFNTGLNAILPVKVVFGASYSLPAALLFIGEISKVPGSIAGGSFGLEYLPSERLSLRAGTSFGPLANYAGFGLRMEKLMINCAVGVQTGLGYTPQISLAYEF